MNIDAQTRLTGSGGVYLAADVAGSGQRPTVILLHGGGQTRHSWGDAFRTLAAKGYDVINYDARGHGESDWAADGDYSFEALASDLKTVVDTIDGPVALVGASMGGVTSLAALNAGLSIAALVLVDIVPRPDPKGVARILAFMSARPEGFMSLDEVADAVAAYNPERPRPANPQGLRKNLRLDEAGRFHWHWDPSFLAMADQNKLRLERLMDGLTWADDIPVMLVRGMKSDVVSDDGIADLRRSIPQLEVVDVAGAGHMVAGDRNDAFNAAILSYLDTHLPLPSAAHGN